MAGTRISGTIISFDPDGANVETYAAHVRAAFAKLDRHATAGGVAFATGRLGPLGTSALVSEWEVRKVLGCS